MKSRKKSKKKRTRGKKSRYHLKIARERIEILFNLAEKEFRKHPERSHRYVEIARRIAMKFNIRLGEYKRKYCKYCYRFLMPGENCIVRLKNHSIHILCKECGKTRILPYKPAAKEKSRATKSAKKHPKERGGSAG